MLEHLTTEVLRSSFLIEFRNLENAMFGYKYFRSNKYFPVNWLRVRNSLHGTESAEQRFSPSRIRQIKKGLKNGASVDEAHTKKSANSRTCCDISTRPASVNTFPISSFSSTWTHG